MLTTNGRSTMVSRRDWRQNRAAAAAAWRSRFEWRDGRTSTSLRHGQLPLDPFPQTFHPDTRYLNVKRPATE